MLVHGLTDKPLQGVANLGVRPRWTPTTSTAGECCWRPTVSIGPPNWVEKVPTVKSSAWNFCTNCTTSLKYDSLDALTVGIAKDCDDARAFFASAHIPSHTSSHTETRRQTTRDRI